jgi:hypothetical protein
VEEGDAAVEKDEDEDRWVVGEKRWQWGRDRVNEVADRPVVLLPGWKELWRPGNDAGPQPRIAEWAARDVGR